MCFALDKKVLLIMYYNITAPQLLIIIHFYYAYNNAHMTVYMYMYMDIHIYLDPSDV